MICDDKPNHDVDGFARTSFWWFNDAKKSWNRFVHFTHFETSINKSLLLLCYQGDLPRSCRMSPITRLHHRAGCHRLHGFTTELPTSKNSLQALSQCHAARNIHIQAHATGHNTLLPTPWSQVLNHHNLNWVCQLTHTHTDTSYTALSGPRTEAVLAPHLSQTERMIPNTIQGQSIRFAHRAPGQQHEQQQNAAQCRKHHYYIYWSSAQALYHSKHLSSHPFPCSWS